MISWDLRKCQLTEPILFQCNEKSILVKMTSFFVFQRIFKIFRIRNLKLTRILLARKINKRSLILFFFPTREQKKCYSFSKTFLDPSDVFSTHFTPLQSLRVATSSARGCYVLRSATPAGTPAFAPDSTALAPAPTGGARGNPRARQGRRGSREGAADGLAAPSPE